jgi:UDP-N-acetylmuramoyl-tripeptide--D-alanyl-D-alanine ligase
MITLTCEELAAATGGWLSIPSAGSMTVDGVTADSRLVPAGRPLFIALTTASGDGHEHARDAVTAGAAAVLATRPMPVDVPVVVVDDTWQALRRLATHVRARIAPITVAITGSVGKTTVKDLTAAAVSAGRRTHAASGSYNNELGVPLTVLGMPADAEVLVAEIGARRSGNIAELAPIVAPDVAIVTAVAPAHLGIFGSIEGIAAAKAELVESLGPRGVAVLHLADERVAAMAERAPRVLTVATDRTDADVHARGVVLDRRARARGTAVTPWGEVAFELPVAGRHHVVNALFALAVAGELGVELDAAAAAIRTAQVSPWRAAILECGGVTVLDDAYNASPTAVAAALETLLAIEGQGRRIAVLGRMAELGVEGAAAHRELGARCAELGVDHLVVVGDPSDPDAEVAPLTVGARDAGVPAVTEVADAAAAATLVARLVRPGDVVLVKASRIVGLERVAAALCAATTTPDGEGRA